MDIEIIRKQAFQWNMRFKFNLVKKLKNLLADANFLNQLIPGKYSLIASWVSQAVTQNLLELPMDL